VKRSRGKAFLREYVPKEIFISLSSLDEVDIAHTHTLPLPLSSMAGLKFDVKNLTSRDGTPILAEAIGDPSRPHVVFAHGKIIVMLLL
jgi:hypothetical protein